LITIGFGQNGSVLNMTHHERRVTRAVGIALLLNAVTVALFVPEWGIIGAAVGFVVSMLVWNVLTWLDARRLVGVDTCFLPLPVGQKEAA
jgi:O-antigen/teichoic acid export membrane protein